MLSGSSRNFFRVFGLPKKSRSGSKQSQGHLSAKASQNKKELHKFFSQVNYLRRFISNLAGKTKVFSDLIKPKDVKEFKWEEQH